MAEQKYLWCPKCQTFPDRIIERYQEAFSIKVWEDDDYYEEDMDYKGESTIECEACGTKLEEK